MRNFYIRLSEPTYRRLRQAAKRAKRPVTVVAGDAIEAWLLERKHHAVHEAIAAYAMKMSGTQADLDADLEAASIELWRQSRSARRSPPTGR